MMMVKMMMEMTMTIHCRRIKLIDGVCRIYNNQEPPLLLLSSAFSSSTPNSEIKTEVDRITRIINDHPFPNQPLQQTLINHLPPSSFPISTIFVENVLGRLFAAHSNGLKALEFFKYALVNSKSGLTADAFEKTLHILARMRYFDKAWELMKEVRQNHPSLLTIKSMSIMLSKIAKFESYEQTLESFERMENEVFVDRKFGTDEFNVLIRAFCTQREMKEARSVFHKMHPRFTADTKTMNILLLGFKESGDITSIELFYHEMVRRGFKPNVFTYNIRIDAYCKKRCFDDALTLLQEMDRVHCSPTLETITTLIHGAGVARNTGKAKQLFDEMPKRNLIPDIGVYNALLSSLVKSRDMNSAMELMNEMEDKDIGHDHVTYHTMFIGIRKSNGIEGVCELYNKMIMNKFVPKSETVVMLMKYFCVNRRLDLGLNLWGYLVVKGYCPHGHVLDLLVTGLCSVGRTREAFECSKQMLERGRLMSKAVYLMLERCLRESNEFDKLEEVNKMIRKLQSALPSSRGYVSETLNLNNMM